MLKSSKDIAKEVVREVRGVFEAYSKELEEMGILLDMGASPFRGDEEVYHVYVSVRNSIDRSGIKPAFFRIMEPTKEKVHGVLIRLLEVFRVMSCFKEQVYGDKEELLFQVNVIYDDIVTDMSGRLYFIMTIIHDEEIVNIPISFLSSGRAYDFKYVEGLGVTFKYDAKDGSEPFERVLGTIDDMDKLKSNISDIVRLGIVK